MELFTAGDKSQMDTIKRWIDESDAYMLILGGRYGSVEPTTGVSYTELEYDYAVEQAKPLFAVVIEEAALEEKVKKQGTAFLERENPQLLKQFRDKVLSRVSSFFKAEADIKLCVHESLADYRDNPDLKGWVSASEIEDTKPLHNEISELRSEIFRIEEELKLARKLNSNTIGDKKTNYTDLIKILKDTKLKLPEEIVIKTGKEESDAFSLFIKNQDRLILGITNDVNANYATRFLYLNLAPKLIRHGLMANEKVANARYRRSYVTAKGLDFLENIERQKKMKIKSPSIKKTSVRPTSDD